MTDFIKNEKGIGIAYNKLDARDHSLPGLVFLGGFRSDMAGTKALFLEEQCRQRGQGFLRFDYSGHGMSGGVFTDLTLDDWLSDAALAFDALTAGPQIIAGSSMGGWLGLNLALSRPRVRGYCGIAAAPDFTDSMRSEMTDAMREEVQSKGFFNVPTEYSPEPYIITRRLLDSGDHIRLLDRSHDLDIPLRLVQGRLDTDVHWSTPERIRAIFPHAPTKICMIDDGDHRLSRPEDLMVIGREISDLNAICVCN